MIVRRSAAVLLTLAVSACGSDGPGEGGAASASAEEASMSTTLEAGFEITGWEETDLVEGEVRVYRTNVKKEFSGDIEGTSEAWLVMNTTASKPAAYSGLEVLDVSIGDLRGTFVLKHDAVITDEGPTADWTVVPSSGTGDFGDITGTAEIERHDDGSHTMTLTVEGISPDG